MKEFNSHDDEKRFNNAKQSIGALLLQLGKITASDLEAIVSHQKETNLLFGSAALQLGLITESDINHAMALQFDYPYLQRNQGNYSQALVAAYQPFCTQVDSLRRLRSQLMLEWFNARSKSLAVVSSNDEEGGDGLVANLAIVFSQMGQRTLLVDANLRSQNLRNMFNISEKYGLSDILAGRAGLEVITKIEALNDLSILCSGSMAPNPQELLNKHAFAMFMTKAVADYDIVLVNTAPAGLTADSQSVIAWCRGALLVSRLNFTHISSLAEVRDQIVQTGSTLVGAVINDF